MSNQIERRPFLVALVALAIGIAAKSQFLDVALLIPLLLLARSLRSWSVAAICLILGFVIAPDPASILETPRYVQGSIQILSEAEDRIDSVQYAGMISGLQILLSTPVRTRLHPGDLIAAEGIVEPISEIEEPLEREKGIQGKFRLDQIVVVKQGPALFRIADGLKDDFQDFAAANAPADTAPWIDALWLRGGSLPKQDRNQLATSGAYSLVAASGLHVFVLWGLITFLFGSVLRLDRRIQILVTCAVLALYCLITGLHESAFRASVTCAAISAAYLFGRDPDVVSVTTLCGLVYLLLFPRLLPTLGFQLSMVVPIALGFYLPQCRQLVRGRTRSVLGRKLLQAVSIVFVVFLSSQPLIAFHTGRLGFGMLLSSIILGFAAPVVLTATLGAFLIKFLVPKAALGLMSLVVIPLVDGFRWAVHEIAQSAPSVSVPNFSGIWLLVYFASWLVVWREREVPA